MIFENRSSAAPGGAAAVGALLALLFAAGPAPAQEPAACRVQVVFAMDTSGSMSDESAALCGEISGVESALADVGVEATSFLWGIAGTAGGGFSCLTDDVASALGGEVPGDGGTCPAPLDQIESWGQAIAVVAERFPWNPGTVRLVVPISDEAPCEGGFGCDQADQDSITNATEVAESNGVFVSPITGTGSGACIITLAEEVAGATGGRVFMSTDPELDLAAGIVEIVEEACITSLACSLSPVSAINDLGTQHTVTATAVSLLGDPIVGGQVSLEVISGPNQGDSAAGITDESGRFSITYVGDGGAGADEIEAVCENEEGGQTRSRPNAFKYWDLDCNGNDVPDRCDISCDAFDPGDGSTPACTANFRDVCGESADLDPDGEPDDCIEAPRSFAGVPSQDRWVEAVALYETGLPGGGGDEEGEGNGDGGLLRAAFVAAAGGGIEIHDVTDVSSPALLATWTPDGGLCPEGWYFDKVVLDGTDLWAPAGPCGVFRFDVSQLDPGSPGAFDAVEHLDPFAGAGWPMVGPPTPYSYWAKDVTPANGSLWVADYQHGVRIFDAQRSQVFLRDSTGTPYALEDLGHPIALEQHSGSGAPFVLVGTTVGIFSADATTRQVGVGGVVTTDGMGAPFTENETVPQSIAAVGDYAYVSLWKGGLLTLDVSIPEAPLTVPQVGEGEMLPTLPTPPAGYGVAPSAAGDRLLLAQGLCGVRVFQIDFGSGGLQEVFADDPVIQGIGGGPVGGCESGSGSGPWLWFVHGEKGVEWATYGLLDPEAGGFQAFQLPRSFPLCGLGPELALLLPALGWLRRRRSRAH